MQYVSNKQTNKQTKNYCWNRLNNTHNYLPWRITIKVFIKVHENKFHTYTPKFLWLAVWNSTAEYLYGYLNLEKLQDTFRITIQFHTLRWANAWQSRVDFRKHFHLSVVHCVCKCMEHTCAITWHEARTYTLACPWC